MMSKWSLKVWVKKPALKFNNKLARIQNGIILVLLLAMLSSCSNGSPETATSSPEIDVTVVAATDTSTPEASPTPPPSISILHAPAGSDPAQVVLIQEFFSELATKEGGQFEVRDVLTDSDFASPPWLVVSIPPDAGVASLASAHPQVEFLAIGIPGLEAAENLSIIDSLNIRHDQVGFLAGYLAAVLTPDWRVGVISPVDTPAGKAAKNGFFNGVIFYCGLCRPVYPPYYAYPIYYDLSSSASQEEKIAAADYLISQGVKTVFLAPGADDVFLLEYLAGAGVNMIGTVTPPETIQSQWIASIQTNLESSIAELWGRLRNGEGGIILNQPISFNNQNEALFSVGRQNFVDRFLEDLLAGYIDTGVDHVTGDLR